VRDSTGAPPLSPSGTLEQPASSAAATSAVIDARRALRIGRIERIDG